MTTLTVPRTTLRMHRWWRDYEFDPQQALRDLKASAEASLTTAALPLAQAECFHPSLDRECAWTPVLDLDAVTCALLLRNPNAEFVSRHLHCADARHQAAIALSDRYPPDMRESAIRTAVFDSDRIRAQTWWMVLTSAAADLDKSLVMSALERVGFRVLENSWVNPATRQSFGAFANGSWGKFTIGDTRSRQQVIQMYLQRNHALNGRLQDLDEFPVDILLAIARRYESGVAPDCTDPLTSRSMVRLVESSEQLAPELIRELILRGHEDTQMAMYHCGDVETRAILAGATASVRLHQALLTDPEPQVREALAGNSSIREGVLVALAGDESMNVRAAASRAVMHLVTL